MQINESPMLFAQQRLIHQLQEEVHTLRKANKQLNSQLYEITHERNNFANIQQKDPIRMILHGLGDPASCVCIHSTNQTLEKRIHLHQEKILTLEQQIRELNDFLNHRDSEFFKVAQQMQSLKQKENFLINQNHRLNLENESLRAHKHELMESSGKYNQKWQKLANQINQAKSDFYQKTQRSNQELQACRKNLDQVRNSWLRLTDFFGNEDEWKKVGQSAKIQQLTDKIKLQSQIMQDLGREVDLRNDEILLLQKGQKATFTKPFDTYEHSLNHMLRSAKERQRNYAELLQKYKQVYENLQESIKQKEILQKQYMSMKGLYEGTVDIEKENKKLKREMQTVKVDLAKFRQINSQLLVQCEAAVEQNDIFFEFMRDIYGSQVFEERIQDEKQKYQQRKKQRNSKQLWANTNELIEMNQKLRQKLRKQY